MTNKTENCGRKERWSAVNFKEVVGLEYQFKVAGEVIYAWEEGFVNQDEQNVKNENESQQIDIAQCCCFFWDR